MGFVVTPPLTPIMTGATGLANGRKGLVPAPLIADVGNFLRGDGTWAAAGSGSVTSVAMTVPTGFTVAGSPITTSGTLAVSLDAQSGNKVLSSPADASSGTPAFRALVALDIPDLAASKITSGQLAVARGGTGLDGSATGGANQFVKQTSAAGAFSVAAIISADLTTALTTPPAVGGTTPAAISGTIVTATTRFVGAILAPAADNTTALKLTKADGSTAIVTLDTTNSLVGINMTPTDILHIKNVAASQGIILNRNSQTFPHIKFANGATADGWLFYDTSGSLLTFNKTGQLASGIYINATDQIGLGGTDAGTNAVVTELTVSHTSTGAVVAGFGTGIVLNGSDSTSVNGLQSMTDIQASWVVATHASRTARVVHNVYDTAAREVLRFEASGSAAMIGVLGAGASARQTSGADLTNNVTAGGSNDVIADFTDLTTYSNSAAAIRNDIYQLARKVAQVNNALRLYGWLT